MKLLLSWLSLALLTSCTTLANRRDLYSPDPGPEYVWPAVTAKTTVTTTTTTTQTGPEFR